LHDSDFMQVYSNMIFYNLSKRQIPPSQSNTDPNSESGPHHTIPLPPTTV
jgi:hypothetical protein